MQRRHRLDKTTLRLRYTYWVIRVHKLASNLEGFLTQLRDKTHDATVEDRQRVLRLLVKDILVGPEKITIRHRILIRERTTSEQPDSTDTEGDQRPSCPVRWGCKRGALRDSLLRGLPDPVDHHPASRYLRMSLRILWSDTLRAIRHEHIELDPVKKPIQINIHDNSRPSWMHRRATRTAWWADRPGRNPKEKTTPRTPGRR
jgi:hypothetical protein